MQEHLDMKRELERIKKEGEARVAEHYKDQVKLHLSQNQITRKSLQPGEDVLHASAGGMSNVDSLGAKP